MTQDFQCGRYRLPLDRKKSPLVMGILNVTPDSFSDGGRFDSLESALERAEQMIADGVDIIDIGGESTRPGVAPLPLAEELRRVLPVVYALRDCGKPLSIDTYKPEVMREAIAAGADMINDINGLRARRCAGGGARQRLRPVRHAHAARSADDAAGAAVSGRGARSDRFPAAARGRNWKLPEIARERLCIDPGFGFGKTLTHNVALLKNIDQIQQALGLPLLAGLSRKSMLAGDHRKSGVGAHGGQFGAGLGGCHEWRANPAGARRCRNGRCAESLARGKRLNNNNPEKKWRANILVRMAYAAVSAACRSRPIS